MPNRPWENHFNKFCFPKFRPFDSRKWSVIWHTNSVIIMCQIQLGNWWIFDELKKRKGCSYNDSHLICMYVPQWFQTLQRTPSPISVEKSMTHAEISKRYRRLMINSHKKGLYLALLYTSRALCFVVVHITLCGRMVVFNADLGPPSSHHHILHVLKIARCEKPTILSSWIYGMHYDVLEMPRMEEFGFFHNVTTDDSAILSSKSRQPFSIAASGLKISLFMVGSVLSNTSFKNLW